MASYDIGDAVPLVYTISQAATVAVTITAPDGTITTPTPTEAGSPPAVTYTTNVAATQAGVWLYRFAATGAVTDSEAGQFYVQPAAATNVYTTLPELKASLSIPPSDIMDDDDLQANILTASRAVEADCARHFYPMTDTRTLAARDPYHVRLGAFMDLVSVTSLKTDTGGDGTYETTWAAGDYQLLCTDGTPNVNAAPEPQPYQRITTRGSSSFPTGTGRIEIVGVWGWPAVPDPIRRATRMMAAELFKLRDAPFGAVGFSDLGIIRVRENPKYVRLINDYRLMEAAIPFA